MADSDDEEATTSKRIKVNAATLVDLKAELAKKKDEFQRQKLTNLPRVKPQKPVIKNKGVEERHLRDLSETKLDSDQLDESRKALERKSKIYEQLKAQSLQDDSDIPSPYLVDFEQKAIKEIQELKEARLKELEKESESDSDSYHSDEERDPSDEWVEFVDCLGRTRVCLRRDLDHYKRLDVKLKPKTETETETDQLQPGSGSISLPPKEIDTHHVKLKEKWADNEEVNKNSATLHYENIRFDEIRDHGTGFYRFSTDEQTRLQQRRLLDELRDKTMQQRKKSQLLIQRRKAVKKERLKRVRRRKRIRMGLDPEESEEEKSSESDTDPLKIPVKDIKLPEKEAKVEAPAEKKVREWDIGKTPMGLEQMWAQKKDILRQDRNEEFAPPSIY